MSFSLGRKKKKKTDFIVVKLFRLYIKIDEDKIHKKLVITSTSRLVPLDLQ